MEATDQEEASAVAPAVSLRAVGYEASDGAARTRVLVNSRCGAPYRGATRCVSWRVELVVRAIETDLATAFAEQKQTTDPRLDPC